MRNINKKIFGVTLVSLLVGITIGSFLIIIMLQIFSASRANFQLAKNLNELNNTIRYVSIVMNDIISQAGYRNHNPTTGVLPDYAAVFQPFNSTLYGPTGSTYNTTEPNSDDPAGVVLSYFPGEDVFVSTVDPDSFDKIWVKFEGDANGRIRDCNDLYGDSNTVIKIRFYSRNTTVNSVTSTAYYCERQNDNVDYTYTNAPTGTPLIPAALFDQAFIRYGEDITGNGFIDRWSIGSEVQNRNRVYAVRVAIIVHTRDDVRSTATEQIFKFFDQTITFNDLKIHKLYIFTIMLPDAPNYKLASLVVTP